MLLICFYLLEFLILCSNCILTLMLSELISCHLRKDVAMAICSCTIDRMCVGVFFLLIWLLLSIPSKRQNHLVANCNCVNRSMCLIVDSNEYKSIVNWISHKMMIVRDRDRKRETYVCSAISISNVSIVPVFTWNMYNTILAAVSGHESDTKRDP